MPGTKQSSFSWSYLSIREVRPLIGNPVSFVCDEMIWQMNAFHHSLQMWPR
jgi:hypothetical protein